MTPSPSMVFDLDGTISIMRVARLGTADLQSYRALMLRAYEEAPDAFTSTAQERAAEPDAWWEKRISDPTGRSVAFGAFAADALVGTVTVEFAAKPKTRHKAHLIGMFVSEPARRSGASRALVAAAIAEAKTRPEVVVMTLTVAEGNIPAVRLYESFGFASFGVEPMAILTPNGYRSKVHMWLPLRCEN